MPADTLRDPDMPAGSLHGWRPPLPDADARRRVLDAAFDYRGDVTVRVADEPIVGYLCNRDHEAGTVQMLCKGEARPRTFAAADVTAVAFTGRDTAAGKSWEAWQKKVAAAEADGSFAELYPESLDD